MLNADSKELQRLLEAFTNAQQQVQTVLLTTSAGTVQELKIELNKRLDKVALSLTEQTKKWAEKDLKNAYTEGVVKIDGHNDKSLHQSEATISNSYIELSSRVQTATEGAKALINKAIAEAEKSKYGATVGGVRDIIKDTLSKENASMVIRYSNGAKMPLDAYASMLARTSRIESSNTGSFDRCKKLGIDLVRCTTMPGCCAYCRMYEGKVYSISGNDPRFPALYKTALQNGYNIMHPNCRHEFIPFVEQMQSPSEMETLIKNSNNFEPPSKDDIVIKKYNQDQATLRQWRNELNEFNSLKATLGNDMPYTTIGSFRRAKRANSPTYQSIHGSAIKTASPPPKRKSKGSYKIIKEPEPKLSYKEKANLVEVRQELSKFIKSVKIDSITHLQNANTVTKRLAELTNKYDIKIASIDTGVRGSANASAGYDDLHLNKAYFNASHRGTDYKKRVQNNLNYYNAYKNGNERDYYRNKRKIDNGIKECEEQLKYERFTFASESGNIEDTVLHEVGHIVHNQIIGLGPNGYKFRSDPTKTAQQKAFAEKMRDTWTLDIFSRLKSSKDIYNVSYYATENERECFAECFVAYETGRELPSYVKSFFNKLIGGKK